MINLSVTDLSDARLTGANLQKVKLARVQLRKADLSGADPWLALGPVNSDKAICSNTNFKKAAKTPTLLRSFLDQFL